MTKTHDILYDVITVIQTCSKRPEPSIFSNKIKTIDHIDLIFSGIHIHPWPHVFCEFGYDNLRNKVTATILVKHAKTV